MAERTLYPFTAIVGQEQMRTALLLHALNPALGGVLIRGEKGTAKSTAVRALAALLPSLEAVKGCPFGCDPRDERALCDACREQRAAAEHLPIMLRPVPVVELPIGATEDRVLGSLDLETAIQSGHRRFEPGLLARANRGILYVDEVNLLGDHLVDILLDAAAMGRNYVEREGISFSHPASFMLIGTMNPEEGDLRPQLLDRFALTAEVEGLRDPSDRAEVVRRRIAFESDPAGFIRAQAAGEESERKRLAQARALLPSVQVPEAMLDLIVRICTAFEVDGMRADLAMYRAASALAAYAGRTVVEEADVRAAAVLALPHRRRRQPFEHPGLDQERLDEAIAEASEQGASEAPDDDDDGRQSREPQHFSAAAASNGAGDAPKGESGGGQAPALQMPSRSSEKEPGSIPHNRVAAPGPLPELQLPRLRRAKGRESQNPSRHSEGERGHFGQAAAVRPAVGDIRELAVAATLRAAAPFQIARRLSGPGPAIRIRPPDLRERLRHGRSNALVLFVVDASGSMGARDRMAATKGAVLALLLDAYRKRDRVGLVAFRDQRAELLLPPTNSVELAERCLRTLPTGGRTPLAAGLALGVTTIERSLRGTRSLAPVLVVVSDGRANSAPAGEHPWQAALREAQRIRTLGWPALVLDSERGMAGPGLARALSEALGATHLPLDRLGDVSSRNEPLAIGYQPAPGPVDGRWLTADG